MAPLHSYLKRVGHIINYHIVGEKVRSNRRLVLVRELLEHILLNNAGFAHTTLKQPATLPYLLSPSTITFRAAFLLIVDIQIVYTKSLFLF